MKTQILFTSLIIACGVSTSGQAYNTAFGYGVTTQSREDSRQFYLQQWAPDYTGPVYWTGDIEKCVAGDIAPEMRAATVDKINIVRAYAGVPGDSVAWNEISKQQQEAALILAANKVLLHNPTPDLKCYSKTGATGSTASLGGLGATSANHFPHWNISIGIIDSAPSNISAGHRRWILLPQSRHFGIGAAARPYDDPLFPTGTLEWFTTTMVDYENLEATRPSTRDGFVAWPPAGYLPYQLSSTRWHFQFPWADFEEAQVIVTTNGVPVPIQVDSKTGSAKVGYRGSSQVYWALRNSSFGENAIVWSMPDQYERDLGASNVETNYGNWSPPQSDQTFVVTIKNVKIPVPSNASPRPDWTTLDSFRRQDFTYTVTIFDPKTAGPPESVAVTEFYHAALDRYFMTGDAAQAFLLNSHPEWGWKATGETFQGWNPSAYPASASPVYRFYGDPNIGPNSHFYTVKTSDYDLLIDLAKKTPTGQPKWNFERKDFAVGVPVDGKCAAENPVPVYILYNNKQLGLPKTDPRYGDPNHRYVTKPALVQAMVAKGWLDAGVAMCGR